ncbi:MAG: carbonic anhydrase [Alphaproteobacteria bacterium]
MSTRTMPQELAEGYKRFAQGRRVDEEKLYAELGKGQSPHTLVISCADSRVDPATIFGADPGELFVIRNVANLVPPFAAYSDDPNASLAGTAAALEFGVGHLKVSRILVMGHAKCGGVAAALHQCAHPEIKEQTDSGRYFIDQWVGLMHDDGKEVLAQSAPEDQQQALEFQNVRRSLDRLMAFPFIKDAVDEGRLTLHGAWFSIADAQLCWMQETGEFLPVEA